MWVSAPSQWLIRKVEQSMLAPAVKEARVIPNGVDLSVFKPADQRSVRLALGIPSDALVLLLTCSHRDSSWKDHDTLRSAMGLIARRISSRRVLFIALGTGGTALSVAGRTSASSAT